METGCGYGYAQARNWGTSRGPRACWLRRPLGQRAAPADPLTFTPCSYLPRMFHGPAVVRGTPQEPRRSTADRVTSTLSLCEWLLGSRRLKQKRKLFPGPPPMDASWFPLPGSCTQGQQPNKELVPGLASRPGYGISTVFPFATNSQPATEDKLKSHHVCCCCRYFGATAATATSNHREQSVRQTDRRARVGRCL